LNIGRSQIKQNAQWIWIKNLSASKVWCKRSLGESCMRCLVPYPKQFSVMYIVGFPRAHAEFCARSGISISAPHAEFRLVEKPALCLLF
jgi:hypothetical protein